MMRVSSQTIITDPLFGKSASPVPLMMTRFQDPPAWLEELPPIDVVLISHNHYDHLEQVSIEKLAKTQSHFVVSLGLGVICKMGRTGRTHYRAGLVAIHRTPRRALHRVAGASRFWA